MLSPSSCHSCVWLRASPLIFTNVAAGTEELALSLSRAPHRPHLSLWLISVSLLHPLVFIFNHLHCLGNVRFLVQKHSFCVIVSHSGLISTMLRVKIGHLLMHNLFKMISIMGICQCTGAANRHNGVLLHLICICMYVVGFCKRINHHKVSWGFSSV